MMWLRLWGLPSYKEAKKFVITKHRCQERHIQQIFTSNLILIEEGLELIKIEYPVDNGFVNILARDRNKKLCIIELKVKRY